MPTMPRTYLGHRGRDIWTSGHPSFCVRRGWFFNLEFEEMLSWLGQWVFVFAPVECRLDFRFARFPNLYFWKRLIIDQVSWGTFEQIPWKFKFQQLGLLEFVFVFVWKQFWISENVSQCSLVSRLFSITQNSTPCFWTQLTLRKKKKLQKNLKLIFIHFRLPCN